ncbi:Uncharacterised protein [Providencia rettgeri]|uniref:Uncharacterized protein n=1 Tax=Providencia rettgeri TaxID=587 RepID=A0A9N8D2J8_PRORE|nr:Uncharacterised protein [Providencia rettgeri]CAB5689255.1 Uncharacterised protein [Providencia rettgeri]CAC9188752.1 Uncharacterised protein [Providencia rettgeri]CAC9224720.1 Uncharacterised protein [Providencia rettgeri]
MTAYLLINTKYISCGFSAIKATVTFLLFLKCPLIAQTSLLVVVSGQFCARSGRGCSSVRIIKFNEPLQVDAGGF